MSLPGAGLPWWYRTMQQQILTEARRWIGTRFAHQGRCRANGTHGGGVDCLGLLMGVAETLNLRDRHGKPLTSYDRHDYPTHPDGNRLAASLAEALHPLAPQDIAPADIVLLRYEGNPQHLGIVSDYSRMAYGLIHAYAPAHKVVEHVLDDHWRSRMAAAFRLPALCG